MTHVVWGRWRELELHHIDLDLGYESSDWPVGFVTRAFDEVLATLHQRASARRPPGDFVFRLVSTDHERAWRIELDADRIDIREDGDSDVDGEVRGWGCDLVAWLYGRDPRGGGVTASGDLTVLKLPQWFPFA
jgi:maleylpyruvate isomerase